MNFGIQNESIHEEDKAVRGYPVFSSAFLCSPGLVGRVVGCVDQKSNKMMRYSI